MTIQLTAEQIGAILAREKGYPPPPQVGPLRMMDKEMRCLHTGFYVGGVLNDTNEFGGRRQGCHSPTFWKVNGIPMCTMHALRKMNFMLYELEGAKEV